MAEKDESARRFAELRALAGGDDAALRCDAEWLGDGVDRLAVIVEGVPRDDVCERLAQVLAHPPVARVRRLALTSWRTGAEIDLTWLLAAIAHIAPPELAITFVTAPNADLAALAPAFRPGARLGVALQCARFGLGPFRHVRMLDVRSVHVEWAPNAASWPDLQVLVFRQRGAVENKRAFVKAALSSALPSLREVRITDEAVLEDVLRAPLLPQIQRLDFTGALTNAGASMLLAYEEQLRHVPEIFAGDPGTRRTTHRQLTMRPRDYVAPPIGELEIDDAWRSRLKQRFGGHLHLQPPPSYPDL